MNIKIEPTKKTQTEGILEIKNVGTQTEISETNLPNRMQDMEERISDIEDTTEEMGISV